MVHYEISLFEAGSDLEMFVLVKTGGNRFLVGFVHDDATLGLHVGPFIKH